MQAKVEDETLIKDEMLLLKSEGLVKAKSVQMFIKREEEIRNTFKVTSDAIVQFQSFDDVEIFIQAHLLDQ